ncbi:MAG: thiamine phosphate synthase, partial [Chloroflexota bacterium]
MSSTTQSEGIRSNIAVILDASGSMQASLGDSNRIEIARAAVIETVTQLPEGTNLSLWVYGHRLPQDDPVASCRDIEQVISFGLVDSETLNAAVRDINAVGYTPISDTLRQVASSFPEDGSRTIVLLSDGEETCTGDPCAVAAALKAQNVDLVVNTVGFAADATTRAQLQCIAQVTEGVYYDAQDADGLTESLQSAAVVLDGRVRIVNPNGEELTDIPFVLNISDGETLGNFVGAAAVPAGDYVVIVEVGEGTTETITVNPDQTTDIVIDPVPIGELQLVDEDAIPLEEVRFSVTDMNGDYVGAFVGETNLPAASYQVEVATIIPFEAMVTITEGETTVLIVDTDAGTIRLIDEATNEVLQAPLFDVRQSESGEYIGTYSGSFDVPPGVYDVTVRSIVPYAEQVTVEADSVVDVTISTEIGTIQLINEATDNLVDDLSFNVRLAETGDYVGTAYGSFDVPPGVYEVYVYSAIPYHEQVTVEADSIVDVMISVEMGIIRLVDEATGEMIDDPSFDIRLAETGFSMGTAYGSFDVPPGIYDIYVYWMIPLTDTVTVDEGQTVDIALDTNADGVHIGQGDLRPTLVRQMIGEDKILGLTINTIEQLKIANKCDVDYVGIGAIFPTNSKDDCQALWGIDGLREACNISKHPTVAI